MQLKKRQKHTYWSDPQRQNLACHRQLLH